VKVRYICDSCRSTIAEFDDPGLTAEHLGIDQLTDSEREQLVQQLADSVVLFTLCDECAAVLAMTPQQMTDLPPQ
jgi:hypothetical protein